MKKNIIIQLCVFTLILIVYSEAFHLRDLYRKLFHLDDKRIHPAPRPNYQDELRQFENPIKEPGYGWLRDGTSPLVRNDVNLKGIEANENHEIAKRGRGRTFGTIFKWTIVGGGVMGGLSMATAFTRLGFDLYFQNNRQCCGLSCCSSLCEDKEKFDELKQALFDTSKLVDAEWVKVEKQHNYIKNLDLLAKDLKTKVNKFDDTIVQFVATLTGKSKNELLDYISEQGAEITKLNITRMNVSQRYIDDVFYRKVFSHLETEAFRWVSIFADAVTIAWAVKEFREFSVEEFSLKFYNRDYKNQQIKIEHLESKGYKLRNKVAANLKVTGVFLKNNWWSISKGLFSLGINVFSVYATVTDILYMAEVVDQCEDLRDRVSDAVDVIRPEVTVAENVLNRTKATLTNVTSVYTLLSDSLHGTEILDFVIKVIQLAGNSSRDETYTTEIAALKNYKTKSVLSPTPDELEIALLPSLISALDNITDHYICLDRKFSILQKGSDLCSNSNNTMYVFTDIWPLVEEEEEIAYNEASCIATTYITQAQFNSFVEMKMGDYGLQTDCFLNSAIAWGRVCTEWRKNITNVQIKDNLYTDAISPITTITQTRVDFLVTKGCNKNSLTTNNKNTICSDKASFLTKTLLLIYWERWETSELTTHYDSCELADQTLLIYQICNYKANNGTDLSTTHAIPPMNRYPLSMFTTQYNACALTDYWKDEICFLKVKGYYSLEELMEEDVIKNYPQTMVESVYDSCVEVKPMTDAARRQICLLKRRGCNRQGCAFESSEYDSYKTEYGVDAVRSAYDGCYSGDQNSFIRRLFGDIFEFDN